MGRARLTRPERAALTRAELLEAAERLFYRDGYHGTTLESIAEEAGYTKGAVYSAFESKAGLFLALVDAITDRRLEELAVLFASDLPGPDRVLRIAQRPVDERNQQWVLLAIEFWVHAARDPRLLLAYAQCHRRLRAGLAALAAQTSSPLGAQSWAVLTIALSNGLALERLIDPDGVPGDLMAAAQRLLHAPPAA